MMYLYLNGAMAWAKCWRMGLDVINFELIGFQREPDKDRFYYTVDKAALTMLS